MIDLSEKNLTKRRMIDLNYNGTTNEYMHTVTGVGVKANQGWNAFIRAIRNELIRRGREISLTPMRRSHLLNKSEVLL